MISLSSKSKTLEDLKSIIKSAEVLPLIRFYAMDYNNSKNIILDNIISTFDTNLIVRSSSSNEDNLETSNAGGFDSVLNVDINLRDDIDNSIKQVISSYQDNLNSDDEVFIQPMLTNVTMSGVIFTADIDTLSSYYIINYDESGSTSSVTSGESNNLKTFICFKENIENIENPKILSLLRASKECENIFNNQFLDIEFAFSENRLYILQVRAIVINNKERLLDINLSNSLYKLSKKIKKLNAPHPNLLGDKTIFGVMPDWNPAEIIGIRPKRLALSLYKELITDEIWAYQRDNYGYRNLRSHPLLVSFLGVPFIDVRVSFNSFIPKNLDEPIAKKLVNYYLDELSKNINHHDKVEFKIIHSCYYFGLEKRLLKLKDVGFNDDELKSIKNSLLDVTNNIIDIRDGLYKKDLEKADILNIKFNNIVNSNLSIIDKIYWLIKDVKRYGTLPFAGVARAGFIAVQILKSFVDNDILSQNEYDDFLNSLNTISKHLSKDLNILPKDEFLKLYGHLRPGTYDILSSRYDEAYDVYFNDFCATSNSENIVFTFSEIQKDKINQLIETSGLKTNFDDFIQFIKEAIEGREFVKFLFTKHLSQILKYLEELGGKFDIDKEELAYLDIQSVISLYSTLDYEDVKDILSTNINKNKEFYKYTKMIKLPSVIVNQDDIYSFFLEKDEANFITLKKIKAQLIKEDNLLDNNLEGKIISIKSADPGYDYLFSKNIGGLITCYGGANSHMAIRCAEIGIPAVIGCGENSFAKYNNAKNLEIDASNKQVKILS
jgi:phosphoenolpyruvate synthase/pyruvate phosphate dikinase